MINKPVIIHHNKECYFEKKMSESGIEVINAYRNCHFLLRFFRRIWNRYRIPFHTIWFNKNIEKVNHEPIIIWDPVITASFVEWVREIHPHKRIILWYWNPVENSINPSLLSEQICEKWSYSRSDCKQYLLNYNTTFYFKELSASDEKPHYDVFFIGKDKGRLVSLLRLKEQFDLLGISTKFHISPTKRFMIKRNAVYQAPLPYDEVLLEIGKSRAILDFLVNPYDGLSLRPMESIFHKKKLITNSQLIEDYDFYRPKNIFILGKDNVKDLPEFLNSPYEEIDEGIVLSYDFHSWLQRF